MDENESEMVNRIEQNKCFMVNSRIEMRFAPTDLVSVGTGCDVLLLQRKIDKSSW